MQRSKHQILAFSLLLQLNTCGQNLKVSRDRRLNPWNFQSDEFYHLPCQLQKGYRGKSRSTQDSCSFFCTNLGMIPDHEQLLPPSLAPNSVFVIPPGLQFLHYPFLPTVVAFPETIIPASLHNSQLWWKLKTWRLCPWDNTPGRIISICP